MKHTIILDAEVETSPELPEVLMQAIETALTLEGVTTPCELNVLLTDDAGIQAINQEMREIDKATDVLSFPMFELTPGVPPQGKSFQDPATGQIPLGDMVLSVERATAQGVEYGHSFLQEATYLTIHSVLHLLGYDHLDEGDEKAKMRGREKEILAQLSQISP